MPDADALITAMRARAGDLRSLGYRVRFDLTEDAGSILLDASQGSTPTVEAADGTEPADTVLGLSAEDLQKLMQGRLSPMLAFATGRLKVEGSKGVAMKLAGLLDEA